MIRLLNKPGTAKVEVADWKTLRVKRDRFSWLTERHLGELAIDKKGMPVVPMLKTLTKAEHPSLPWPTLQGVSLLTVTQKMAALSFSIPAGPVNSAGTCLAANLSAQAGVRVLSDVERSGGFGDSVTAAPIAHRAPSDGKSVPIKSVPGMYICDACYAGKASYKMYANVHISQRIRHLWVIRALGRGSFVQEMTSAIRFASGSERLMKSSKTNPKFFRIHDAGDFYSIEYMMGWFGVCASLPEINFWAPTRMFVSPQFRAMMSRAPKNLAIRPSSLFYGVKAPMVPGMSAGSTSAPFEFSGADAPRTCPAYQSGVLESCEGVGCRACWTMKSTPINYLTH